MTFKALIQALCDQARIDIATAWQQQESGAQTAAFVIDGHLYSLFNASADSTQFLIRGDIGPLPEKEHHAALLELLQLNVILYGEGSATFGADPGTNRLVVLAALPLQWVTADSVLGYLHSLAGIAARWRSGYLFSTAPHAALADPRIDVLKTALHARMEQAPAC